MPIYFTLFGTASLFRSLVAAKFVLGDRVAVWNVGCFCFVLIYGMLNFKGTSKYRHDEWYSISGMASLCLDQCFQPFLCCVFQAKSILFMLHSLIFPKTFNLLRVHKKPFTFLYSTGQLLVMEIDKSRLCKSTGTGCGQEALSNVTEYIDHLGFYIISVYTSNLFESMALLHDYLVKSSNAIHGRKLASAQPNLGPGARA